MTMPSIPTSPLTDMFGTDPILGPISLPTGTPWWWIGDSPNPNPALVSFAPLASSGTTIIDFQPLSLVPGFINLSQKPFEPHSAGQYLCGRARGFAWVVRPGDGEDRRLLSRH